LAKDMVLTIVYFICRYKIGRDREKIRLYILSAAYCPYGTNRSFQKPVSTLGRDNTWRAFNFRVREIGNDHQNQSHASLGFFDILPEMFY